jgi:hypothetical protein
VAKKFNLLVILLQFCKKFKKANATHHLTSKISRFQQLRIAHPNLKSKSNENPKPQIVPKFVENVGFLSKNYSKKTVTTENVTSRARKSHTKSSKCSKQMFSVTWKMRN